MDNSFYLTKNVPEGKLLTLTIELFFLFNKNKQLLSVEYLFSCMNVDNIFIFILQPASQLETLRILWRSGNMMGQQHSTVLFYKTDIVVLKILHFIR